MNKMLSRAEALEKWRNLSKTEREELAKKHKPEWSYIMVGKSSSAIQTILNKE